MRKGFSGLIAAMVLWSLSNATALAVSATSSTSRAFVHEILPAKFGGTLTRQWAAGVGRTQTAPSIAPKTAPACTGGWNQVASPTTGSGADALNATAAVSATDIWAAGVSLDTSTTPNRDRKSTRLNSSHGYISYAVFC